MPACAVVVALATAGCQQPQVQPSPSPDGSLSPSATASLDATPSRIESTTVTPTDGRTAPEPSPTAAQPTDTTTDADRFVRSPGFPAVLAGSGAHGSGCAPGTGPLPDGVWFGVGRALSASSIEFDLACFFTGAAASERAADRGLEAPPPNDYLVVNDRATTRTVPVSDDVTAWRPTSGTDARAVSWSAFAADPGPYLACPGDGCLLWLYVNDGVATEVAGQYVP